MGKANQQVVDQKVDHITRVLDLFEADRHNLLLEAAISEQVRVNKSDNAHKDAQEVPLFPFYEWKGAVAQAQSLGDRLYNMIRDFPRATITIISAEQPINPKDRDSDVFPTKRVILRDHEDGQQVLVYTTVEPNYLPADKPDLGYSGVAHVLCGLNGITVDSIGANLLRRLGRSFSFRDRVCYDGDAGYWGYLSLTEAPFDKEHPHKNAILDERVIASLGITDFKPVVYK